VKDSKIEFEVKIGKYSTALSMKH